MTFTALSFLQLIHALFFIWGGNFSLTIWKTRNKLFARTDNFLGLAEGTLGKT